MTCFLIKVSGFVQGVFFRHSAKTEAEKLRLVGYAKNLEDESVEMVVCGEKEKIGVFIKWCQRGSALAQVERVETREIDFQNFDTDFLIV